MKNSTCDASAEIELEPLGSRENAFQRAAAEEKNDTVEEDVDEIGVQELESEQLPDMAARDGLPMEK